MKSIIKMSKAGIAALVFGIALTGCGGGSSSGDSGTQAATGSGVSQNSESTSGTEKTVERTATLSWNAPLQRQNNEALKMADLSGYVISFGQDPDSLDQTVRVDNAATMEHTVTGLGDGTWYFSVQAEDNNGLVSPPSDLVSKTIQS